MRQATVILSDELEKKVDTFLGGQESSSDFAALVEAALRRYLEDAEWSRRGFTPPSKALAITPAAQGSGTTDTARHHDEVLANR
jgi:metal-responsive CopG/Arc/MetJ family transcriptional regulator